MDEFFKALPKAELHVHIEGTLTPARAKAIALRNGLALPQAASSRVYAPGNEALNSFLNEYNQRVSVLRTADDFRDVMLDYLQRAVEDGVKLAEVMVDPQIHCYEPTNDRHAVGKPRLNFDVVIDGLWQGIKQAKATWGIDAGLIMCFLQDRSLEEADAMLTQAIPHCDKLLAVGMDNGTGSYGPGSTSRFKPVYARAAEHGLRLIAHAGEEEGAQCVRMALDVLNVDRIDHGVRALEDPDLIKRLAREGVPLTVCPLSNEILGLHSTYFQGQCPLRRLIDAGVPISLNSDDPAYFASGAVDEHCRSIDDSYDGYIAATYRWTAHACALTHDECVRIAEASFRSSFASEEAKRSYLAEVRAHWQAWQCKASKGSDKL